MLLYLFFYDILTFNGNSGYYGREKVCEVVGKIQLTDA